MFKVLNIWRLEERFLKFASFLTIMNLKNDLINMVISLAVTIALAYFYVWMKQPFSPEFLVVYFLLILIFLEVASIRKKK